MQNRIMWADQAKALAIALVAFGHYGMQHSEIIRFIYIFHVPVFFFISGYFDNASLFSIKLLNKYFRSLMVPYFFFSVCAILSLILSPLIHPGLYGFNDICRIMLKSIVGMFIMQDEVRPYALFPFGPLWFLVALFWVRILFSIAAKASSQSKYLGSIVLLIFWVVGYLLNPKFFSLDSVAMAIPIYSCGYAARKYNVIEIVSNRWISFLLCITGALWLLFCGVKNGVVGMDGADYGGSFIMFYINAIVGSLTTIFFFKAIDLKWNWLSIIGASTLTILGTHGFVGTAFKTIGSMFFFQDTVCEPLWFEVFMACFAVFFGVYCQKLILRYRPEILGKRK